MHYEKSDNLHVVTIITGPENVYLGLEFSNEMVASPRVEDRCRGTSQEESEARGRQVTGWVMEMLSEINEAMGNMLFASRIVFVSDSSDSKEMYRRATHEIVRRAFNQEQ